jgi:hypothetical protein
MLLRIREPVDQTAQGTAHPDQSFSLSQSLSITPGDHDGVRAGRQPLALEVERLAQKSFHPIAIHGSADFAGH